MEFVYHKEECRRDRRRRRRVTHFLGTVVHNRIGVHGSALSTLERGLFSRVFVSKYGHEDGELAPPNTPDLVRVRALLEPFRRELKKHSFGLTPMTHTQYVESRGRKRLVYERAHERLQRRGLQKRDWELDVFVKAEKLNLTKKSNPDPRIISPRSAAYNIVVGSFIHPLESLLYAHVALVFACVTIMKGLNAEKMGALIAKKWQRFGRPVAVGFDVHRMDQHISCALLSFEHSVYHLYIHSSRIRALLKKQLKNVGHGKTWNGKVKFSVSGRRASGDVNTGLGNCIIMCAVVYSALYGSGIDYELINNGDDCVLILDESDRERALALVQKYLLECCLPTEFEPPVYELEHLEFCQMHPVFDGTGWVMVRDPRVCLDKDACTIKPVTSKRSWDTLRNSVGLCGLAAYGNMPLYNQFYAALRRGAGNRVDRDAVEDGLKRMSKGMQKTGLGVTVDARVSFFRAFDISPREQVAIEEHYSKINPVWSVPRELRASDGEGVVASLMGCVC